MRCKNIRATLAHISAFSHVVLANFKQNITSCCTAFERIGIYVTYDPVNGFIKDSSDPLILIKYVQSWLNEASKHFLWCVLES